MICLGSNEMTTIEQVQVMTDEYFRWLRQETTFKSVAAGEWVEITTPMLDRHNDHIQIYVRHDERGWYLTDDSFTLDDLAMSGCEVNSSRRKFLLDQVLNGFGVSLDENNAIYARASDQDFARQKHFLLQAILAVNDLFYLSKPNIERFFFEDVADWLDHNDIRNSRRIIVMGKSHYSHQFDFIIPKSKQAGERFIKLLNNPTQSNIKSALFSWIDTKENREQNSSAFVIVNDENIKALEEEKSALESYGLQMFEWSKKENFVQNLAA